MTIVSERTTSEDEGRRRRDSLAYGYLPREHIVVDPSVVFHSEADPDVDPITYEVIRSKFWNLNMDHEETIRLVSGSNIVIEGYDFNASILTEEGEGVVFGPSNLFFAGCADLCAKWTLEHRSANPGIHDGDVFIQNDPWVGTNHQMDVAVFGPVFWEDRLFGWVYNAVHQREIGGIEPGGFIQSATDVYTEPTFWPPTKFVEGGTLREDIVDAWVRRSRLPALITLELKSQLAGYNFARRRLLEMLERYGAPTVKGVMRRMIHLTSDVVGTRLSRLPDATWRDSRYVAGACVGDNNLYRLCLSYTKVGDRLRVTNAGTDKSVGSFNITPGVQRACVLNALIPLIAHDQYLCGAGVLRQLDFEFGDDAITSAWHPAAVSTSLGTLVAINQAQHLAAKMLSSDPDLERHVFASSGLHTLSYNGMWGTDQYGNMYADLSLDCSGGGIGGFAFRDGIHHGGSIISATTPISNCEAYERVIPFLYLYRKEVPNSGGHGTHRGGSTIVAAWTGHMTSQSYIASGGIVKSVTQAIGLNGGYPATGGWNWHATNTEVLEWLQDGRIPEGPEELRQMAPHGALPELKKSDNRLLPGDVFEALPCPGAGYGDPLLRSTELVAKDFRDGRLNTDEARTIYGVVIADNGLVDEELTLEERKEARTRRLSTARLSRRPVEGFLEPADAHRILAGVVVETAHGQVICACSHCGRVLCRGSSEYRLGCAELEQPLTAISELFTDPCEQVGEPLVFRRYLCPSCALALDGEICRSSDEPFADIEVATVGPVEAVDVGLA